MMVARSSGRISRALSRNSRATPHSAIIRAWPRPATARSESTEIDGVTGGSNAMMTSSDGSSCRMRCSFSS